MKPASALRPAVASAMAFLFLLFSFSSCKKKGPIPFDPAFAQYISAYTSGTISAAGNIRVRLTDAFKGDVNTREAVKEDLLDFSPSIDGELFWIDNQTLEFRPAQWLPRGEVYEATLKLNRFTEVPSDLKEFRFSFVVMKQHMDVQVEQIRSYRNDDLSWMYLNGTLTTFDVCEEAALPQTIVASEDNRQLHVSWQQSSDPHTHHFTVDSIQRSENERVVQVVWKGEAIDAEQEGSLDQKIPALGDFRVFFFSVNQQPEQYVQLLFSDPLDPSQNLEGLIDLQDSYGEKFTVEGNEVRVYPAYRMAGNHQLNIHPGIRNISGYASVNGETIDLHFEEMKPEVRITDHERVILPGTNGLVFPFEAVNLSAVDVRVLRIYESNVPQFLQVNDLYGDYQMRRVGRVVKRKTVQLNPDGNTDLAVWNTFYLDMDEIIKAEPGAIYRVEIGFRRAYSLYHCAENDDDSDEGMQEVETETEEEAFEAGSDYFWDEEGEYGSYYDEYDEYYEDYDWNERENPCNAAYYMRDPVGKNILASDIGLIAKHGEDKSLLVVASDLRTAKPLSGADIEVLNYQQQVISSARTDKDGMANFSSLKGVPFLVVAKEGKQRAYLKVDGTHALNMSTFDIGGEEMHQGLKGFIYGERGVWRPGDSLYLAFILEDEKKVLPAVHPVNFELVNPRGQIVQKLVRSKGVDGFFNFTCSTDNDAPTGIYQANIRVGGAVFTKSLRVETIKPNRLKLQLDFGNKKILSEDITGTLSARWLHGANAGSLKANVSVTFTSASSSFEKFKDYVFDDPIADFSAEEQTIFDQFLDAGGNASLTLAPELAGRAPGMLNAAFSVKVFEQGGDFSVDRFVEKYAPYDRFVGVKTPEPDKDYSYYIETDKEHQVKVVTLDAEGKPVRVDGLKWKLYKVNWRWWWERSSQGDLANYVGSESTTPVAEGSISTNSDGKGQFAVRVNYPEWGRYFVRVEDEDGGHASGHDLYFDWPDTRNREERVNPEAATVLAFALDKERYLTGEKCTVTIPSSRSGRALVSIENGSGVLQTRWIETKEGQTQYSFTTTVEMTPNAYVNITMIQPHNQTENDLPIRMYGVVPLFVENPGSHLTPVIRMADELEPEKEFTVQISEKEGKAMTYTLAIVDEGLLDITRYKTPDPWNYFYAREALGVNSFDLYDQVIGAYGSKLERLLSLGGDGEINGKGKNRANRFKPVVMYKGPFTVEAGKTRTHSFRMPNYVGSVRVMVAAGKDMAYGHAEKSVAVKKPLMVLASLPRVLGPGEEIKLPVTVFAMDPNVKEVKVSVESNGFLSMKEGASKTIRFVEPGDQVVNFPAKIQEMVGQGKLKIAVSGGGFKSSYDVDIEVRNPNPVVTQVVQAVVDAGKYWSANFDQAGMNGTNSSVIEISSIPPVDFGKHLKYLIQYPHGCVEQTTSSAFPQLYLSEVIDAGDDIKARTDANVRVAINQLMKFQLRSGAMSYWPGNADASDWGTSYSGHFLLEAKKKGYTIPSFWENAWIAYQQRAAQQWAGGFSGSVHHLPWESELAQAYRLYTLALAGKPELGAMNRLKERQNISQAARWRLAAAYALAGQTETARALVQGQSAEVSPYQSSPYTYGSSHRDRAMMIETLTLLNERERAASLVLDLAKTLSSDGWYSTQTVAYSLLAISSFTRGENGRTMNYSYSLNGGNSEKRTTNKPIATAELRTDKLKNNKIEVSNSGGSLLYVRIINRGQPAVMNEKAEVSDLYVEVKYTTMSGSPLDISRMQQGTDFLAEVRVWNPGAKGRYDELALTQIFPSGWEIINNRLDASASVMNADMPEYQDIRDDRIYSYFDLAPNQTKKFRVKLNATYLGKYYLPAVNCEAMYDHAIYSRTAGQWVEVVDSGQTAMK